MAWSPKWYRELVSQFTGNHKAWFWILGASSKLKLGSDLQPLLQLCICCLGFRVVNDLDICPLKPWTLFAAKFWNLNPTKQALPNWRQSECPVEWMICKNNYCPGPSSLRFYDFKLNIRKCCEIRFPSGERDPGCGWGTLSGQMATLRIHTVTQWHKHTL